ncbi:MAG: indolepyruvate ferredoxin oxidoreductase family protein, partial [Gammaproteobacteria bacterium]|nr:indolepyruvate ferredoxin oxidoreductase family protein [Gammaproteobacteria bacterium]
LQSQRDHLAGLNTAAYITGYRGSPLGALDIQFWQAKEFLAPHNIVFQPAINEDLAATALWGTQQAELDGQGKYDGVFGIWYGKGPGVDRSGDAFRHANLAGTSRYGGVLAAMGDDHACESSTTAHQSEFALVDAMMPILNPSNVQDILDFGLTGWALSRYSGCWIGLKCVHDTVEATASIELASAPDSFVIPEDILLPPGGLNIRWPDTPLQQEQRLHEHKLPAVHAFWRENSLDRLIYDPPNAKIGIVTTGKSYSDVRRALTELGLDRNMANKLGIRLYKVALSWPLEKNGLNQFTRNLQKIIVVEEKRALIEDQIKTLLYGRTSVPVVVGKRDQNGEILLPSTARLNAMQIATVIGEQIFQLIQSEELSNRVKQVKLLSEKDTELAPIQRMPYFCAGCPHNTSTKVPEGSVALAGIGCHYMVQWMDRSTARFTQMGGEGASWIGESLFSKRSHVFQNVGDGTYLHSGLLAIRAAVAAKTTMTFKVLYNDAVAMTGGQPFDGPLSVSQVAHQLLAEGVAKVSVVTDDVDACRSKNKLPSGVNVVDRHELDSIQRQLRDMEGVTAIIYDQTCAAEKRRRRKRGQYPDPAKRVFINTEVCEGCGDCGIQSNCVAILPHETEFGRKRRIDQSSCNKDYTCIDGFCPSFVSVIGGAPRKPVKAQSVPSFDPDQLPLPEVASIDNEFCIVVTGVGGTGVITLSAILGMAAHLDELGCSVLDMTGLAQKGGSVLSNLIIAQSPDKISSMHVANGGADLIVGGDLVVSASDKVLLTADPQRTRAVVNNYKMMSGDFTRISDLKFPDSELQSVIEKSVNANQLTFVNSNHYAEHLFGDTIAANFFMIGIALQKGYLPISLEAIERAIELNARSVEMNKQALHRGRQYAVDQASIDQEVGSRFKAIDESKTTANLTLQDSVELRAKALVRYQNNAYADRYRKLVQQSLQAEESKAPGMQGFAEAVARYYYKLLAYKDEYEVARLYSEADFRQQLERQFEGDYQIKFHMAPPIIGKKDSVTGLPIKTTFGPWMERMLPLLAKFKFLRGTPFDPFGRSDDRRMERKLIFQYEQIVNEIVTGLTTDNHRLAIELARYPEFIRGYGHIKRQHVEEFQPKVDDLLHAWRQPETTPQAA